MHDRRPEAAYESKGENWKDHRRRAPDGEARPDRPLRPERDAEHEHDRRQERVDVERPDPLAVFPRESDAAAGADVVHRKVGPEEPTGSTDRTAELQSAPDDGPPVPLREPCRVPRRGPPGEDRRGRWWERSRHKGMLAGLTIDDL